MAYARSTTVDTGPAGDTIVQGATDLDTDLTAIYTDLNTHEALTETHGATGAIVGTTNTQIITNKTLYSPTISGGSYTGTISWIPAETKMVFYQDVAPTGWTIDNTLDDKVLFVTKGSAAGGQVGGGAHSTGTWTHPNHTHTAANSDVTLPAHTHTFSATSGNESADHAHTFSGNTGNQSADHYHVVAQGMGNGGPGSAWYGGYTGIPDGPQATGGVSANHVHAYSGTTSGITANHSHTVSGTSASTGSGTGTHTHTVNESATANTWRPSAYCVIIATKD
jgi:hypothetical protein